MIKTIPGSSVEIKLYEFLPYFAFSYEYYIMYNGQKFRIERFPFINAAINGSITISPALNFTVNSDDIIILVVVDLVNQQIKKINIVF